MKIYAVKIPEKIESIIFDELLKCLPDEKQKRIKRCIRPEIAMQRLVADILVRSLVQKHLSIKNSRIEIKVNNHGKPYIPGADNFHFNISHSHQWVVCAVDDKPIGVDVELIKPVDFNIAKRFFCDEEYKSLMEKDGLERLHYFYTLWTLKESYLKAIGTGMAISLRSFSIKLDGDKITLENPTEFRDCYFMTYDIDANYKLSVCAKNNSFPGRITVKDFNELCFFKG
ncbi:4'-phosphopantetheinyl transferase family protein [Caldanaerobius polysaccharolyticus]|uniref:4'-phosphopantetheinyl transferase family protein n=1 Tax=Caldanaerobius polysaccharolyticus TaxID=44256 RepID=UPI00047CE9F7|nr:4'-phosphopantetheinyl transferase superfamily protein [Caldanaerobius polysaccharolyticus]